MILTNFPWVGGVSFLIYLSGLQAIPESVYEAGELEGLGAFKRLVYIDLPLLVSQIKYFIIIGVINGVPGIRYSADFRLERDRSGEHGAGVYALLLYVRFPRIRICGLHRRSAVRHYAGGQHGVQ